MATAPHPARVALLAGGTGLIGRALLTLLLASPRYVQVHALARRTAPDLPTHPKLHWHTVDFKALPALPPATDVFIALGTTIKVAGSQAAFREVDFDAVLNTARAAHAAGATRLAVVSSLGADAKSRVFYTRVKGEMQAAVAAIGFDSVLIVQPSLLTGDRSALGQPARPGEVWASRLTGWLPRNMRPIAATRVAQAMLDGLAASRPGIHVLRSGDMH